MYTTLRKHWLLLPTSLCLLVTILIGICWYLYKHDHIVVYPAVVIYDYTDTRAAIPRAWAVLSFFLLSSNSLLFLWMKGVVQAQRLPRILLVGVLVCLLGIGLWVIKLQRDGGSWLEHQHDSVSYWHIRYLADVRRGNPPHPLLEGFQCDEHLLLCHLFISKPFQKGSQQPLLPFI